MASTLNEMANKLQAYIIDLQSDAHSSTSFNLNTTKYNNIKLAMDETVRYPHIMIRIGISEATYSLRDGIRTDGGLGPDEKYVHKWLGNYAVIAELLEIYMKFRENLTSIGDHQESDDYAIEVDANGKIRRVYEARAAVGRNRKQQAEQRKKEIKKEVKDFLKSNKRRLR